MPDKKMTSPKPSDTTRKKSADNLPTAVVGIGSSAGGLEALSQFFSAMPVDSGIAFVLVCHLDPHHDSLLPDLLSKKTRMTVRQITDNLPVAADQVYIIPPNKELAILNNHLQLLHRKKSETSYRPIDVFFRSLARDQGAKAVGIILSGTGSDGTLGIKAIKELGGLVIVQDKESAQFEGMPVNAQNTGLVDTVLRPHEMPARLLDYTRHSHKITPKTMSRKEDTILLALQKVFGAIRAVTGHDFSLYKTNTIYRRIERRMYVHKIVDIDDYVEYLHDSDIGKYPSCSRNC